MGLILIYLVIITGSRGGIIGLICVAAFLILSDLLRIRFYQKVMILAPIAILMIVISQSSYMKRISTLGDLESDYNVTEEEGRLGIWKRGLRISLSNPILGVGVSCFPMAIGYNRAKEGVLPKWQSAHNSFVQVLVETGYIGFWLYITVMIRCLRIFKRTSKNALLNEFMPDVGLLSGLLYIAFFVNLICAFFLSQGYSILYTFFVTLSAKLHSFILELDETSPGHSAAV